MSLLDDLTPSLRCVVDEAFTQGFRVFVARVSSSQGWTGEDAYLCLDAGGSFACVGTYRLLGYVPLITAPIKPHTVHGNRVLVDFTSDLRDQMAAIRRICDSPTVDTKLGLGPGPVFPNYGMACLSKSPSGIDGFAELTADGREIPIVL
jgi:hypothetical protein